MIHEPDEAEGMTERHPYIFEIGIEVWNAVSNEEIEATVAAMQEFGIYKLPYDDGEIIIRIHHVKDKGGYDQITEISGLRETEEYREDILMCPRDAKGQRGLRDYQKFVSDLDHPNIKWLEDNMIDLGPKLEGKQVVHRYRKACEASEGISRKVGFRDALVVLLASKGTVKSARKSGLASLGIGKKRAEYITTIKIAGDLERHESAATGRAVRPHLRRGHIRNQHHGPQNSLIKRIWVDPCFVNADADFVSSRKAYRVIH